MEQYAGRSRIFCNGKCVTARNLLPCFGTLSAIVFISLLFFIFDGPNLSTWFSPCVPIAGAVLMSFVLCCLGLTALSDPGIVPRASSNEAAYSEAQLGVTSPQLERRSIVISGRQYELKYCVTCRFWRPPRCSHCSVCDNCVHRFDHHCIWVGNCIGRRNYRHFFMFTAGLLAYSLFILVFSLCHVFYPHHNNQDSLLDKVAKMPTSFLNATVAGVTFGCMLFLMAYHARLVCSEISTCEEMKQAFVVSSLGDDDGTLANPFDQGSCAANCCYVLCGPAYPGLLSVLQSREPISRERHDSSSELMPMEQEDEDEEVNPSYS